SATQAGGNSRIGGRDDDYAFVCKPEKSCQEHLERRIQGQGRGRLYSRPSAETGIVVMSGAPLTQLGRYRILAELGRGNMGVVYRAEDPLLDRTVAVKTIVMMTDPEGRAEYEARFYQEAKAAGGLNHPNLITIHDIGREGDIAYMAMELLEGV